MKNTSIIAASILVIGLAGPALATPASTVQGDSAASALLAQTAIGSGHNLTTTTGWPVSAEQKSGDGQKIASGDVSFRCYWCD